MEKQMNIPKLRFPEFKGEWEKKKLGEVAERVTAKNSIGIDNVLTISAQNGLISQLEFFNKSVSAKNVSSYYLLSKDDFAYNKSYSKGYPMGAIKRLNRYERGVVSTLYICFRNKKDFDNSFAEQYYETGNQNVEIEKVAQEGARNHGLLNIGVKDFFDIQITIPTLPEQTRIASFFTVIDKKISELKQKKALLEQYKKGVMQKLFSQELRFKNSDGKDFPDWERKKLGEVGTFFSGGTPLTSKREYFTGNIPFIRSGEINSDSTEQFISEEGLKKSSSKMVEQGDLLYALYGATSGEVGISKIKGAINQAILCIRTKLDNRFLHNYLLMEKENIIKTYLQGGQGNLSADIIKSLQIPAPSLPEQTKIANFLSALDEKINRTQKQIAQAGVWKKGLLQQMFC